MCRCGSNKDRLEMNLGIIAASIATIRPLFVNLGSMVRVASDPTREPYDSDRPFFRDPKASKASTKLRGILLNPTGITKTTDVEVSQEIRQASGERV